ncbi:MAG: alkaline phosphatase D family protein [Marinirhabdus sp.]|nr:alkaline phosphatase D family protein [Marinirhabdus sp.]
MRNLLYISIGLLCLTQGCKETTPAERIRQENSEQNAKEDSYEMSVVFVSCNDQDRPQPLWKPIANNIPAVFVWGGDNIYADTENMDKMANDYQKLLQHPDYAEINRETIVLGTWDDHDYGKNDAGKEWPYKEEAKQLLLDFLGYHESDSIRKRPGVYHSRTITMEAGSVKFILLDTRTFRTPLKESTIPGHRYMAWPETHKGTILGEAQWKWLEDELADDTADFTVLVSSIQFLSDDHGWEKWGNFPSEVKKMYALLKHAKAQNILMLSGDRHMAEISVNTAAGLPYPLVDFTSSGLTHTWIDSETEANEYRVSNVVKQLNFGRLKFDFENEKVRFEIRGADDFLYEAFVQNY